ncbi:transcription-repair coupling factor [Seleniivibrio woodruffii]|uniref:Transcription-repair-coupling factor n=1 Tax=Seleniivibrio woodruffii TaxID=1078050 RepID=A0A4R1K6I9_9BACT|nr:transcription-repair coupling factor [Seleniivibrio woodruffii]TCK59814.1 transcription-repair coupling factor [Seleniivibrio woodruffii]TVZ35965.1 transcription-repair coupling factor (superfamily II helicase) [Seleniivibrio woodruffii]
MKRFCNLWGCSSVWYFYNHRPEGRVTFFVAANRREYELVLQETKYFFSRSAVLGFPEYTQEPFEEARVLPELISARAATLHTLLSSDAPCIVVTTPYALLKGLPPADVFKSSVINIKVGEDYDRQELEYLLNYAGYVHVELVDGQGEYAFRGDILEVFPADYDNPCLIEFFGDEAERISLIDSATRKPIKTLKQAVLLPASEALFDAEDIKKHITDKDILDKAELYGKYAGCHWLAPAIYGRMSNLLEYAGDSYNFVFFTEDFKTHFTDLLSLADRRRPEGEFFARNFINQSVIYPEYTEKTYQILADIVTETAVSVPYKSSAMLFGHKKGNVYQSMAAAMDIIKSHTDKGYRVVCAIESERLMGLFDNFSVDYGYSAAKISVHSEVTHAGLYLFNEKIRGGFIDEKRLLAVFSDEDIFGVARKKPKRGKKEVYSTSISDLESGDYVVHVDYGIGIYKGLVHENIGGVEGDFLQLEYENGEFLYVPLSSIGQLQKYIGSEGGRPRISSLQTQTWKKLKAQARTRAKKIAFDLLQLYAKRKLEKGFAFNDDGKMVEEFEQLFEFDETDDQLTAIHDVYSDMENQLPMERLVCGDVGFGKTEVAMRAACKAVAGGKQVAVLVPTTVLARQHYLTFKKRFGDLPINVDYISRFRSAKDVREILHKLAKGQIDVLVGTHKLLGKEIEFTDLGLLIIDEEQRFGVAHKEKIKAMKTNVDVLYLSATPIPRTLQLSLSGIRDISVIDTPPVDRLPVITKVVKKDEEIKIAIQRELERGGQVFYLHNKVEDIDQVAAGVRGMLPGARVAFAHGQMEAQALEKILMDFYSGETDVLVCTAIIENGIDIPNVNTIIINNAAHLGLAQIYQLKGRVGRSVRRGYCYLVVPNFSGLSLVAQKRLKIIQQLSDLGSGVKIAFYDLQLRGAGDLLGADQSGFVVKVGYELFIAMIDEAVKELKGITDIFTDTEIITGIPHYIPADYIEDTRLRLDYYRKFSYVVTEEEALGLLDEMAGMFGDPGEQTRNFARIMLLKNLAGRANIEKIYIYSNRLKMKFSKNSPILPQILMESASKCGGMLKFEDEYTLSLLFEKAEKTLRSSAVFLSSIVPERE